MDEPESLEEKEIEKSPDEQIGKSRGGLSISESLSLTQSPIYKLVFVKERIYAYKKRKCVGRKRETSSGMCRRGLPVVSRGGDPVKTSLTDFVHALRGEMVDFDNENLDCFKKDIRKALDAYHLKS